MPRSFPIILLFIVLLSSAHSTPVLFWKAEVTTKAVFPRIEHEDFLQEIKTLVSSNKTIIAFTYDKLLLSNFRCEDCFSYLSQQSSIFYANVEKPAKAFRKLSSAIELSIHEDGRLESPLHCQPHKLYMIALDELKKRSNPMKSCDDAIKNIVTTSIGCEDAAYVFLGTHEVPSERSGRLYQTGKFSFYLTQLQVQDSNGSLQEIEFDNMNVTGEDPKFTVELVAQNSTGSLQFYVTLNRGYFEIDSFKFNDINYYVSDLYAPITHSFSCGKMLLKNDKKKLIIKRLQIQYDAIPHPSHFKFKNTWTCEGFTSPAIISGLFVIAILVSVLIIGISMLMNVQTPTKFEAAGGPILHINVVE